MGWEQWLAVVGFVVSGLGAMICCILWYLITGTISNMRRLEAAQAAHELNVAKNFATRDEVDGRFDRFQDTLERLQKSISQIDVTISAMAAKMNVVSNGHS